MQKKHLTLLVVFNVFLVFFWCLIVRWIANNKLNSLAKTIESRMGNKVNSIKSSNLDVLQSSIVDMIAQAKTSVVSITISKDVKFYVDDPSQTTGPGNIQQQTAKVWWWSGIIVSKKWYIITNKHVVQDTTAKYAVILYDGQTYNVDKIRFDELLDVAIMHIIDSWWKDVTNLQPASFHSLETQVDVWQFVFAIGNSFANYSNNVTMGIIWGKNKQLTINKNNLYVGLYQTDALVNPGNSGGPLLDINWSVVGMTTAIAEWEGIAFALPISKEFLASTITSIERFGKIVRPILWIQYIDNNPSVQQSQKLTIDHGIYINDVLADLPARQAGLQIGDVILSIQHHDITTQLPFLYQLYTYIPGDQLTLDILRAGKNMTLTVILGWNIE